MKTETFIAIVVLSFAIHAAFGFEGRITAALTQGGPVANLVYTVGTNYVRIEQTDTGWPHARDIVNLQTGEMTLLFPNNRSFVRLDKSGGAHAPSRPADASSAGAGSQALPTALGAGAPPMPAPQGIGPTNLPGAPAMPQMPAMPGIPRPGMGMPATPMMPMMMGRLELRDTGHSTNLLGLACEQYELKQRGETMEIWATDRLLPFQLYLPNQPHRFGPRMIEEQWGDLLKAKQLFPLLAMSKIGNGAERYRFEVQSITPEKINPGEEARLFQPPSDYQEIRPLPF